MKNNIPEKIFDQHMHIVRDVHFDVDKYKIGELYVINHIVHPNYLHFGEPCKTVGYLKSASEHSLQFRTMKRREICNDTDAVYYIYAIDDFTLTIDEIIDKEIEIERLMTETEATVYLGMAVLDEAKQSTLDPKDPKFNRLLGIVPDHSQFPYILERTHSYQELQAAYKIDEETAKECVDFGQMAKDLVEEDPVAEMVKHRDSRYLMSHLKSTSQSLPYVLTFINDKGEFDPTPFEDMIGNIKITMSKGTSEIVWYTAKRNIRIVPNTIEIRNRNGTVQMILTKDTFFLMFDKITFEDQQ
jgi:hypothetical protein